MKKTYRWYILGIIAFIFISALTFGSSIYAKNILSASENVTIWVVFPVGKVTKPMAVPNPSGGKVFVKPVVIDIQKQGTLKKTLNHWRVGLSSHWVVNVGPTACRPAISLTGADIPIEFEVRSGFPFDDESKSFLKPIQSGQMVPNLIMDWVFEIPPKLRDQAVLYNGALVISNADTKETLSTIPIKIINGEYSQ
jgi:hypothetical protein